MATVLEHSDPLAKAELYNGLGLRLVYQPAEDLVAVEATPVACATVRVGGGELRLEATPPLTRIVSLTA
jgi:hypothetical protein